MMPAAHELQQVSALRSHFLQVALAEGIGAAFFILTPRCSAARRRRIYDHRRLTLTVNQPQLDGQIAVPKQLVPWIRCQPQVREARG